MNVDTRIPLARVFLALRKRQLNVFIKEKRSIFTGSARTVRCNLAVHVSAAAEVFAVRRGVTFVERYGLGPVIRRDRRATDKNRQYVPRAEQSDPQIFSVIRADTITNANHLCALLRCDLIPRKLGV